MQFPVDILITLIAIILEIVFIFIILFNNKSIKVKDCSEEKKVAWNKRKKTLKIVAFILGVVCFLLAGYTYAERAPKDPTSEIYDDNGNGRYDPEDVFGENYEGWIEFAQNQ